MYVLYISIYLKGLPNCQGSFYPGIHDARLGIREISWSREWAKCYTEHLHDIKKSVAQIQAGVGKMWCGLQNEIMHF